jgi:hypothetical protein
LWREVPPVVVGVVELRVVVPVVAPEPVGALAVGGLKVTWLWFALEDVVPPEPDSEPPFPLAVELWAADAGRT